MLSEDVKEELVESCLDHVVNATDVGNYTEAGHWIRQAINLAIHSGWTLEGRDALPDSIVPGYDFGCPAERQPPLTSEQKKLIREELMPRMLAMTDAGMTDEEITQDIIRRGWEDPLDDEESTRLLMITARTVRDGCKRRGQKSDIPDDEDGLKAFVEGLRRQRRERIQIETEKQMDDALRQFVAEAKKQKDTNASTSI